MGPVSLQTVRAVQGVSQGLLLHRAEESAFSNWLHEPCLGVSQRNVSARVGQLGLRLPIDGPNLKALGLAPNNGVVKERKTEQAIATTNIPLKMTVVR